MENQQNKVLLDCRFWGPANTGLGRYSQELVKAMRRLKPRLKLIFLTPKLTAIKPYSWAEQRCLSGTVGKYSPDLTHFLHFNVPLNFSGPFVVTIHDLIKHHSQGLATTTHWPGTYWIKRLGYYLVIRKAVMQSKAIFVPSRWVKEDILAHYPTDKNKIFITPEAARQTFFASKKTAALPYPYFIYVGNAYPHKNVIKLIKAIQISRKEFPKLKLVIVTGRDWFYRQLRQEITKLNAKNTVKLKDFTADQDLAVLYQGATAFVTASYFEGFGLPGLEAMAAGTLVISSNRAALPQTYGKHAVYFDPDNLDELVAKMKQVLTLSATIRKKRLTASRAFCRQYSWTKTAQQTVEVYESCLGLRSS